MSLALARRAKSAISAALCALVFSSVLAVGAIAAPEASAASCSSTTYSGRTNAYTEASWRNASNTINSQTNALIYFTNTQHRWHDYFKYYRCTDGSGYKKYRAYGRDSRSRQCQSPAALYPILSYSCGSFGSVSWTSVSPGTVYIGKVSTYGG